MRDDYHIDGIDPLDEKAEGCLMWATALAIAACIAVALVGGCASMPNTLPALPAVQGFAALPNCVTFCTIHVNIQKAASEVTSTGTGAVTGGAQSQSASSTSTQSSSDTTTRPQKP